MSDEEFRTPRLAAIYDDLDPDRSDLDGYVGIAEELGASRILDVGCGTGSLAPAIRPRALGRPGIAKRAAGPLTSPAQAW